MVSQYLIGLLVTIVIEVPVVALVFRDQWRKMALTCLAATIFTHLVMHFILPFIVGSLGQWIVVGEAIALLAEAGIYFAVSTPRSLARALIASSVANSLSYGTGLLLLMMRG